MQVAGPDYIQGMYTVPRPRAVTLRQIALLRILYARPCSRILVA